jgi:hypothetical protein
MVDIFALLVSLGMLAMVTFFAIQMDRTREWFERPRNPTPPPKEAAGTKVLGRGTPARGIKRPTAPGQRPARFPTGR